MKNKKLLVLLALSLSLVSCGGNSSTSQEASSQEASISSLSESSSQSPYKEISDVSKLFHTYNSTKEFNFIADYSYSTIYHRQYKDTVQTSYQYNNGVIQLTYSASGSYYTDYYYANEDENIYTYYIDMGGQKEYQTISGDNEYYYSYVAAIDTLDISNIDWAENFVVDEDTKTLVPASNEAMNEMGAHIFGEKSNEYWEKLEINYADGYISEINAISIYMETVYYFTVKLSDHSWVDFDLPEASQEYVGTQPYYKNEDYQGVALTSDQAAGIEFLANASDANYTVSTYWEQVSNGALTGNTITTESAYADGNAFFKYTSTSDNLTHSDYIVESNGSYIYYQDDGTGAHTMSISGTDEYTEAIQNYALDQLNLAGLKASDFIYNEEKGYFMPKDNATEKTLCGSIFGYSAYYYGLHIYMENNVISKIETSLFIESGSSVASYKKTYTITKIGTTVINYPSDINTNNAN